MLIKPQSDNQFLMFSSLDDFIGETHPVRIIGALVDALYQNNPDLHRQRGFAKTGRPAYSSDCLLKIFVYGYINRIKSSRALEQETYRNIELMWLIGNLHPDHKTIINFRADNKQLIDKVTREMKIFLRTMVIKENFSVAIDGTKLKANASREMISKERTIERLSKAEAELEFYIKQINEQDALEDQGIDEAEIENYRAEIVRKNIEIERLKAKLNHFQNSDKKYFSTTDPDCNMMKTRDGSLPAYNAQFGCDTEYHFILYDSVTDEANDINQLVPAIETLESEIGELPNKVLVDSGYCNLDSIEKLEEDKHIQCFAPVPKEQGKESNIKFTYDPEKDEYTCSQGHPLTLRHKGKKAKKSFVNVYVGTKCIGCPLMSKCTKSKTGRNISRFVNQEFRQKHRDKMKTSEAKNLSLERKSSIEHIHGTMKIWLGKIPLLLRGIDKVATEIKLFALSWNIKRLINLFTFDEIMAMIKEFVALIYQKTNENSVFLLKLVGILIFFGHIFKFYLKFSKFSQHLLELSFAD